MREIHKRLLDPTNVEYKTIATHPYVQVVTQRLKNKQNPELWLKHQDYYWYSNEAQSIKAHFRRLSDPHLTLFFSI